MGLDDAEGATDRRARDATAPARRARNARVCARRAGEIPLEDCVAACISRVFALAKRRAE